MQLTQKVYRRAALAALAALGILLPGAGANAQSNYRRQSYNSAANYQQYPQYQQPMRLAASQAPPAPVPVTQPTPADDAQSPFADDPDSAAAPAPAPAGDGIWQSPPCLPGRGDGCCDCFDQVCCPQRCACWYGGADYFLAKPHFSQGYAAIVCQTTTNTSVTPNVSNLTETAVPFPYRYTSMYRVFAGLHLTKCGGDILFTYWNLQSTAATSLGPANVTDGTNIILGQVLNNPADGQFLNAQSGIRVNIFDIDFSKYVVNVPTFGACSDGCCPRWDIRWLAGVRIAQVYRFDNNQITNPDGSIAALGMINANFYGAGPKIGFQVRRYIGDMQRFSIYARGAQSLLLGQFHGSRTQNIPGDTTTPTSITTAIDNTSRVIPVTDIEVGGSVQLFPSMFVSAGWFAQCWWDLGYGETISSSGLTTSFGALDTSNIMAWSGMFVRAELFF